MNPPKVYGIWTSIFDYVAYFTLFSGVFPFWATRFVSRGKPGTIKTSTIAQLFTSLIFMAIYEPVIYLIYIDVIARKIGTTAYLPIFLLAGLYIVAFYMITVFEAILQPKRPQTLGYGLLIEEIVKVGVALILILGFHQLFLGAMLALILSFFAQVGYYVWLLADDFKEKTNWSYLKEWFKGSTVIAFNAVGNQLSSFVYILLFFYGGPNTRAYYQAAGSFTAIIGYSISLSIALYPRLLSQSCSKEQVGTSFRTVMMLGIPIAAITMVMSFSFLTVLNVTYGVAWPVLVALSIYTLFGLVSSFYSNCVMGVEIFDAEGKIGLRRLIKSKIFVVFALPYLNAAIAIPLTYLALTMLPVAGSVQATLYVVVILIAAQLSTFTFLYTYMRHSIGIPVAWKSMGKYALAAALAAVILYLLPTTTTLLSTIAKAIAGFVIYVAFLLAIDKQARELIRQVWNEVKGNISTLGQLGKRGKGNVSSGETGVGATEN
jgi:hypothetical protein